MTMSRQLYVWVLVFNLVIWTKVVNSGTTSPLSSQVRIPRELGKWSYSDTSSWKKTFTSCAGLYQSPINIGKKTILPKKFPSLITSKYNTNLIFDMKNNGHSVKLTLKAGTALSSHPVISGIGLTGNYVFSSIHFHWGGDSSRGSEHRLQHKQFPAEMHIVHYKEKYGSLVEALKHSDGLAVLAVLYQIQERDNPLLNGIIQKLSEIKNYDSKIRLRTPLKLDSLLPTNKKLVYRYHGSLTTPPCQEIVEWSVFGTLVGISESQMRKFRELKDWNGFRLQDDFRPVQPINLNKRKIFYNTIP